MKKGEIMATLDNLFLQYLHQIEPSDEAVERAANSHNPLREDLEKDEQYGTFVIRTLLSGSYGRCTSTFFIKDVDVIIQTSFTKLYLQTNKRASESEQEYLLRLTKEAIDRTGRVARTMKRHRSIYVTLPKGTSELDESAPDLTMDIVPVLIQTNKDCDPMTIADRDLAKWDDTYPLTQLADSEERNQKSSVIMDRRSYKPLVKIFRAWKQVHFSSTKTPKGFVLECLTARYHTPNAQHWIEAVRDLFRNICQAWPDPNILISVPEVPDISNLAPRTIPIAMKLDEAQAVLQKIHDHLTLVEQAIQESKTDLVKSAKTLQRVFGQDYEGIYFPLPEDENGGGRASKSSPMVVSKSDVREAPQFG